jgi:hypothetical protein
MAGIRRHSTLILPVGKLRSPVSIMAQRGEFVGAWSSSSNASRVSVSSRAFSIAITAEMLASFTAVQRPV